VRVLAPDTVLVFGVQDYCSEAFPATQITQVRRALRIRSRIKAAIGLSAGKMQMHCLPKLDVLCALGYA